MKRKQSNKDIDERLKYRNILRLDSFDNSEYNLRSKVRWQCMTCQYIWNTTANHILNDNSGCPNCSNVARLSNFSIDEKLKNRNIIRLESFDNLNINGASKVSWQCKVCNYIWKASATSIIRISSQNGCPNCAGNIKLDNLLIDKKIINLDIKRLSNFDSYEINVRSKTLWECLICNNIWETSATFIINLRSGCPYCSRSMGEQIVSEILNKLKISFISQKEFFIENFKQIKVDFYIKSLNLIIEYNGLQHYQPVIFGNMSYGAAQKCFEAQVIRDNMLKQYCQINNINLLEIDCRSLSTFSYKKLKPQIHLIIENKLNER